MDIWGNLTERGGVDGSDLPASAGAVGDGGSIPGPGRAPGGGNSMLAWRISGQRSLLGCSPQYSPWSHTASDPTEPTCTDTWAMSRVTLLISWLSSAYVGECSCF